LNETQGSFIQYMNEQKIASSKCVTCGALYLPPKPICSTCTRHEMTTEILSGEGVILGLTSISIVPSAMLQKGYGRQKPYTTGVIRLNEGVSVGAFIELPSANKPIEDYVGVPVTATFRSDDQEESRMILTFQITQ